VDNYFNYFTETEEYFLRRRGGGLLLSTLDWALIETWKDAGIPLAAVLRGIEAAFERYEKRPSKRKVNGLAYCAQEVLSAAEQMKEAAVGGESLEGAKGEQNAEFQHTEIAAFLRRNADQLEQAKLPERKGISVPQLARETIEVLRRMASETEGAEKAVHLESLERRLTVLEEKLFAVLLAATPDEEVVSARAEADDAMAPYRRNMPGLQIEQLQKQYVHKRLLARYGVPRFSLFYM
jgi:hypothetical protein